MKKWGHLHTLSIGAILGVVLTAHVWMIALTCFLLGLFARRLWDATSQAAGKTGALIQARIETEKARRREVQSRARRNQEKAKATRAEAARIYKRGLMDGHLDAGRDPWPGETR